MTNGQIKGVVLKKEIIEIIESILSRTGESFSSFVKQAIMDKLYNLNLITTPIKKEMLKLK